MHAVYVILLSYNSENCQSLKWPSIWNDLKFIIEWNMKWLLLKKRGDVGVLTWKVHIIKETTGAYAFDKQMYVIIFY